MISPADLIHVEEVLAREALLIAFVILSELPVCRLDLLVSLRTTQCQVADPATAPARTCLRERHGSAVQRGNGRRNVVRLVQDHDIPFEPHACEHARSRSSPAINLSAPRARAPIDSRACLCKRTEYGITTSCASERGMREPPAPLPGARREEYKPTSAKRAALRVP